jgi:hypothetical protein
MQAGAPVPQGRVVRSAAEAKAAVQELGKKSTGQLPVRMQRANRSKEKQA